MSENSQAILKAVEEIRDLLKLMAEPAIAKRDAEMRAKLRDIVGKSKPKAQSVLLMDGNRTQAELHAATGMNKGHLSTLVSKLRDKKLLMDGDKRPKLAIIVPSNFFDNGGGNG